MAGEPLRKQTTYRQAMRVAAEQEEADNVNSSAQNTWRNCSWTQGRETHDFGQHRGELTDGAVSAD